MRLETKQTSATSSFKRKHLGNGAAEIFLECRICLIAASFDARAKKHRSSRAVWSKAAVTHTRTHTHTHNKADTTKWVKSSDAQYQSFCCSEGTSVLTDKCTKYHRSSGTSLYLQLDMLNYTWTFSSLYKVCSTAQSEQQLVLHPSLWRSFRKRQSSHKTGSRRKSFTPNGEIRPKRFVSPFWNESLNFYF